MNVTKKILINTLSQLGGQIVVYGLGAMTTVLVMRYLGPVEFGKFSLVFIYIAIFGGFVEFGGQAVLVREINQRPLDTGRIMGNYLILKTAQVALVCLAGIAIVRLLHYPADIQLYLGIGLLTVFLTVPGMVQALFQAKLQMWYPNIINVITRVLFLAATVTMILLQRGLSWLVWGNLLVVTIASAMLLALALRRESLRFTPDWKMITDIFRQTIPVGLLMLVGGLVLRVDALLLSKMGDQQSLGLYNAAYKYVEWGQGIMASLMISHFSIFTQYINTDIDKVRRLYRYSVNLLTAAIIPGTVFCAFVARDIVQFISGPSYLDSAGAVSILLWVVWLNTMNILSVSILLALREQRKLLLLYVFVVAVNIAVNVTLIPRFGFMVCAWASVLSEVVAMGPLLYLLKRRLDLLPDWNKAWRSIAVAGIAVLPLLWAQQWNIVLKLLLSAAFWFVLNMVFKAVTREDAGELLGRIRGAVV